MGPKKTENQKIVADDILRYKKNKFAQTLALIGLVFNVLYFLLLYAMPKLLNATTDAEGNPLFMSKSILIGVSVLLTLIVLLAVFLSSEGVKGYNKTYSIVLLVVAVWQIIRIFGYPLYGLQNDLFVAKDSLHSIGYFGYYPTSSTPLFVILLIYLIASATCFVASAVWGYIVAKRLEIFQKKLDNNEISLETVLKEMDKEDERQASNTLAEASVTANEIKLVEEDKNA